MRSRGLARLTVFSAAAFAAVVSITVTTPQSVGAVQYDTTPLDGLIVRVAGTTTTGGGGYLRGCPDGLPVASVAGGNASVSTVRASSGGWSASTVNVQGTHPWPAAVGTISYNNNLVLANGVVAITAGGQRLALNFTEPHIGQTGCGPLPTVGSSAAGEIYAVAWNAESCNNATCSGTHSVYSGVGCMAVATRGAVMTMTVETGVCTPSDFPVAATGGVVASCPDYYVIDSRGSGEDPGTISPPGMHLIAALKSYLRGHTIKEIENAYPARGGFSILATAKLQIPGAYFNSVNSGKTWLGAELVKYQTRCPQSKVILTGYSQGAQVTADVIQRSGPFANVKAVVLFGDPYFNGRDPVDRGNPRFRTGVNGGLGERKRYTFHQVLSYCHSNDPVCQNTANPLYRFKFHENYQSNGEPEEAARIVAAWVK